MDRELLFWAIALVMVFVACSAVAWAFLRPECFTTAQNDADELSRTLLNEELATLKKEFEAGLITQAIYDESVEDVKRRALEDLSRTDKPAGGKAHTLTMMFAGFAVVAAGSLGLYAYLGSPSLIVFADSIHRHGIMQPDGTLVDAPAQYDARTLRAYLADNAKDERAWVLYARLLVEAKDWAGAAQAYRAAIDIKGKVSKDADVLLEYAASLMSLQTDPAYEEGYGVIQEALKLDETHVKGHELAAIACLELSRWKQAREHLEVLLGRLTFNSPAYRSIAETAAFAAQQERLENERNAKPKAP
mgnify:CR=1 FL=1